MRYKLILPNEVSQQAITISNLTASEVVRAVQERGLRKYDYMVEDERGVYHVDLTDLIHSNKH
jgi:hypothetical protein